MWCTHKYFRHADQLDEVAAPVSVSPVSPVSFSPEARNLQSQGYTTLPLIPADEIPAVRRRFRKELSTFPEYLPTVNTESDAQHFVQGGFGALGNPSSFHAPFVRDWRWRAHVAVVKSKVFGAIIDQFGGSPPPLLEQIIDRLLLRRPSKMATAESWHRDEAVGCAADGRCEVYGGWINMDSVPQSLSCVPRSHLGQSGNSGFAPIKKFVKGTKTLTKEWAACEHGRKIITVPPGHMLIFNEKLLHEIVSKKRNNSMYRLFTGWRVTRDTQPLGGLPLLTRTLEQQGVARLKSGQTPPMYGAVSWSQPGQRKALSAWSVATFQPQCLEEKAVKKNPSEVHKMVQRHMKSLKEYGFQMYPKYTDEERSLLIPGRSWKINGEVLKL